MFRSIWLKLLKITTYNRDEILNKDVVYLVEETKDDQIFHSFDDILEYFADEEGLSMTIKIEKNLGEE